MLAWCAWFIVALSLVVPAAPGRLVDAGGHKLHVNCSGKGGATVIIETGLGDFSFDWALVQQRVSTFARVCTYDRGGYAWSEPGPLPRTFAQLNFELRDRTRDALVTTRREDRFRSREKAGRRAPRRRPLKRRHRRRSTHLMTGCLDNCSSCTHGQQRNRGSRKTRTVSASGLPSTLRAGWLRHRKAASAQFHSSS